MEPFCSTEDAYERIETLICAARDHPDAGPALAAAGKVVQVNLTDPECFFVLRLHPPVTVELRHRDPNADIVLSMPAEIAHRFWRGEYNLAVGIATGKVDLDGDVGTVLDIAPAFRPLFPTYRELIAEKLRRPS